MTDYEVRLRMALNQTQASGLSVENFQIESTQPANGVAHFAEELTHAVINKFAKDGDINRETLALKCCEVNLTMKPFVERIIGAPVLLTVGGVKAFHKEVVVIEDPSILAMAQTGKYHVWLTLPWLEILDLTLLESLKWLKRSKSEIFRPLSGYPDLMDGFAWTPWWVGSEVGRRLLDPFKPVGVDGV
jgi:hypothetical protein